MAFGQWQPSPGHRTHRDVARAVTGSVRRAREELRGVAVQEDAAMKVEARETRHPDAIRSKGAMALFRAEITIGTALRQESLPRRGRRHGISDGTAHPTQVTAEGVRIMRNTVRVRQHHFVLGGVSEAFRRRSPSPSVLTVPCLH